MAERRLRILQVSTADVSGGAEKVAWNLLQAYRQLGHETALAVGFRSTSDPDVVVIPSERSLSGWGRTWRGLERVLSPLVGNARGARRLRKLVRLVIRPQRVWTWWNGREDFDFPGSWDLLDVVPWEPDVVHVHNLHGGYFDLETLPGLCQRVPVVLTLHDAWLLSGHCAHSFDCERWKTGCGHCPDLTIYPGIRRDATAENWQRKQQIYSGSRFYLATPSRWLMQKVEQSMLRIGVVEARVIPYGVDRSVFHPADRQAARMRLGIPRDTKVVLFAAHGIRRNIWRDYPTLRAAMGRVAKRLQGVRVLLIALGEDAPAERVGDAEIRFAPYQVDASEVARYYQAAELYAHAARADTFPNTVLEALACGTPVVATAVGGIPEQVKGLQGSGMACGVQQGDLTRFVPEEATGVLTAPGDAEAMAVAMEQVLRHDALRAQLGGNAARDAMQRFDLQQEAKAYQQWYAEILQDGSGHSSLVSARVSAHTQE